MIQTALSHTLIKGVYLLSIITLLTGLGLGLGPALMGASVPFRVSMMDQTPTEPLVNPDPNSYQARLVSGFGSDGAFTVFFADPDDAHRISYLSTTTGPSGFKARPTATNISDAHFVAKDWPVSIGSTTYAYRGWGSAGDSPDHHFYVSNDLTTWTLVSTFTIPNASGFLQAQGQVHYGFHDVLELNGAYYAFAESNQSQTMIVSSATGTDDWAAFDSIGGRPGDGPLGLPRGVSAGWAPSGSFVNLGHDRGYGKIFVDPRGSDFYLAINTAARASLPSEEFEAAFINPANWTWHDRATGPAANPVFSKTREHDLGQCWVVPSTDPDAPWIVIYTADFESLAGSQALGYALMQFPPELVYVDDDWGHQADVDVSAPNLTWQYDAFDTIQDGIDAVADGGTVNVRPGFYGPGLDGIRIGSNNVVVRSSDGPDNTVINLTDSCADGGGIEIDGNSNTLAGFQIRDFSDTHCKDTLISITGDNNVVKENILQGNLNQAGSYYPTTFGIADYGADTMIDSNEISEIGLAGIYVAGPPHGKIGAIVSNNNIHHVMKRGIDIDRCPHTIVTQNTISDIMGGTLHGRPADGSQNVGVMVRGDSVGSVIVNQNVDGLSTGISLVAARGVIISSCEDGVVIGDADSRRIGSGNRIYHCGFQ